MATNNTEGNNSKNNNKEENEFFSDVESDCSDITLEELKIAAKKEAERLKAKLSGKPKIHTCTFIRASDDKYNQKKKQYVFEIEEDLYMKLKEDNCKVWVYDDRFFFSVKYDKSFEFLPEVGDRILLSPPLQRREYLGKKYIKFHNKLFARIFNSNKKSKVW